MEKKRLLVNFDNVPDDVLSMIRKKYPSGYFNDMIKIENAKKEVINAILIETDDIIYLVKVNIKNTHTVMLEDDSFEQSLGFDYKDGEAGLDSDAA